MFANGGPLTVGDRRQVLDTGSVGFGTIVNAGSGATLLGNDAHTGKVWSVGQVTMNNGSRVHGFVRTSAATITRIGTTTIDDNANTATGVSPLPLGAVLAPLNFTVTFPPSTGNVIINADAGIVDLAPGSYGTVSVGDRSTLRLSSGFYFFNTFQATAAAILGINTSASPGVIEMYVASGFQYQCRQQLFGGSLGQLRIIYTGTTNSITGTNSITLDVPPGPGAGFSGIVLALGLTLGIQQELVYNGSFYARSIILQPGNAPNNTVVHIPWDGQLLAPQVTHPLTAVLPASMPPARSAIRRPGRPGLIRAAAVTPDGNHFDVTLAAPTELDFREVAVLADGGALTLDAGAQVLGIVSGFATIVNVSSSATTLAAGPTSSGDIWSVGNVTIGAGAHVHGTVRTAGTLTAPPDSIDIPPGPSAPIPLGTALSLSIDFPDTSTPVPDITSDTPLPPGAYAAVHVVAGALELSSGTYHFESFNVDLGASVRIQASAGPVEIFVRDGMSFAGSLSFLAGSPSQLRIVYVGTTPLTLLGPVSGTVIAARAPLVVGSGTGSQTFVGTFIGQSVQLSAGVIVRQETFFEAPAPAVDRYIYGFSGRVGAGPYPRTLPAPTNGPGVDAFFGGGAIENNPGDALGDLAPVVTIGGDGVNSENRDSLTYLLSVRGDRPITSTILQAIEGTRPYVRLFGETDTAPTLTPTATSGVVHRLEVDGLWLASGNDDFGDLLVTGSGSASSDFDWDEIVIRHATFDPGGTRADGSPIATMTLAVTGRVRRLVIARSILGPIDVRSADGGSVEEIVIVDSIIDATAAAPQNGRQVAIHNPAGVVIMRGVTVLGDIRVEQLQATDSLVMGQLVVANTQDSCFRFSAASPAPDTIPQPKKFHAVTNVPIEPFFFTSIRFGDPGYAQLSRLVPEEILRGAESSSEMGAFSFLLNPIRLASILTKVEEFGPVGMLAQYIFEGETSTGISG